MSALILSRLLKAVVFTSILLIALTLWGVHVANEKSGPPVAYDKFLVILNAGALRHATIYMGYDTAEVRASLKNLEKPIHADVPTNELPKIIKQMMDEGASVEFAKARRFEPAEFVLDILPYLLILVFSIMVLRMRKRVVA